MEKENLNILLKIIDDKCKTDYQSVYERYEELYAYLELIKDNAFGDLTSGVLSIVPVGDFMTGTNYENSTIDFLVVYQTIRENIDFSVVAQKVNKKGKVKVSTYQAIMGGATNKGIMQAEQVAERFGAHLKVQMPSITKIYTKRNQIMVRFADNKVAKIIVCYKFDGESDLVCRRVNTWYRFNNAKLLENLALKNKLTKNRFIEVVRFFKALEIELIIAEESTLLIGKNGFVENYLYNVPTELFLEKDKYVMIENILVYLKNKNPKDFMLADETDLMFNAKSLYTKSYAKQFVNKIDYAFEYFEEIISADQS